jgi:hypothetical protein
MEGGRLKLVLLIPLLLVLAAVLFVNSRRREARRLEAEAAAKAKAARRSQVPTVSSNLKGVTATQTVQPVRPANAPGPRQANRGDDDRAA